MFALEAAGSRSVPTQTEIEVRSTAIGLDKLNDYTEMESVYPGRLLASDKLHGCPIELSGARSWLYF